MTPYGGGAYGGVPYGGRATDEFYGTLTPTVRRFYEALLEAASRMASDPTADEFDLASAVTMAGTACEVAAGTATTAIIDGKQLGSIALSAIAWIRTFNLAEDRIRDTWNAIASDTIQTEPFWADFQAHVKRRNKVAHTGQIDGQPVKSDDAHASISAVRQLIEHIGNVLARHGLA